MPEIAFMYVHGIDGESNVKNQSNAIEVFAFDHEVTKEVNPLDCSKIVSDRHHGQASIVKRFDKATPLLHKQLCEGAIIKKIEIKWYRQPASGGKDPEHYFTHTFDGCIITSIRPHMPNALDKAFKDYGHMEKIYWGYRNLTWKADIGGTEFTDEVREEQ